MEDDFKSLHNAVSKNFNVGTYQDFVAKMQTKEDRRKFYDIVSQNGFDLGDYDSYEARLKKKEPSESISPKTELASDLADGTSVSPETQPKKRVTTTAPDGKPVVVEWGPTEFKSSDEAPMDARLSNILGNVDATIDEATKGKLASAIGVSGGVLSKIIGSAPGKTTGEAIVDAKKFVDNTIAAYNVGALDAQIANNLSDDVPDLQRVAELKKKQKEESSKLLSSKVGQGVGDVFETMATSPATYLTELITTSATRIAGGLGSLSVEEIPLAVGLGIVTGGRGTSGYLSGRNSLAAEMSSRTLDKLEEKGIDVTDPAQLRSAFGNKELMDDIAKEIEAPSSIVAALDVVSAMAAGSLGTPIREMVAQMAAGSAGEAGAQLAESGEITSPAAVITEAIAEIPGGLAEVGFAAKTKDIVRKAKINQQIKDVESQIETAKNPETKDVLLGALNRLREEKNTIYKEFADFANKLSEEDVAKLNEFNQQIVKLNKAIEEVENEDIKASLRDERDAVVAQIAELESKVTPKEDAVQEQAAGEIPVQPEATVGEEVAQGEPQAEPEVAAEEVVVPAEEEVAAEEAVAGEVPTETQELTEQDLPGFDRMMTELDGVIKKSEQRKASRQKTFENAMNYVVGSKAYESATDVQRESMVRMVNKMFAKREKSAPSVKRLFADVQDIKNITASEYSLLKNQIQSAARGAREAKTAIANATKEVGASLKELVTKGQITLKQANALVSRFSKVNPLNDVAVERFVNYATKVFNDAEYNERMSALSKLAPTAKKNTQKKLGIADGVTQPLLRMFSLSPETIPNSVLPAYTELMQMMAERKAVLNLDEITDVKQKVESVLDAVDLELGKIPELSERFLGYEDKVTDKDGKVDFAKTLEKMVKEGVIDNDEAAILRDNRSSVMPSTEKTPKSEEEIAEERQVLLGLLEEAEVDFGRLPMRDERELAKNLSKLVKTAAVEELDNTQLNNLLRVIENINNGYLPHYAELMVERLRAINDSKTLANAVSNAKPLPVSLVVAKVKSLFTKKAPVVEMLRRIPTFYMDQQFGNFKSKDIFNTVFGGVSKAQSRYESFLDGIRTRLQRAEDSVFESNSYDANKSTMSKYKMMTYLRELEFLSNPGSKQVNPAAAYLQATIDQIESGKSIYTDADAIKLQEIQKEYVKGGAVDMDALYSSFNSAEKKAIQEIQDINTELRDKAIYTSAIIRGDKITPLENYTHLNVLHEHRPEDTLMGDAFINDYNNSLRPSTKAKSLIARTGKVSPINFDVFSSTARGANYVLMDYYLTEPVRTARKMFNETAKSLKEGQAPKEAKGVLNEIESVFEESIDNLLSKNFSSSSIGDEVGQFITRQGYRSILASLPRAVAELFSNLSFAVLVAPKDMKTGIGLRDVVMSSDAAKIMNAVGSKQTTRLYPNDSISGRLIDTSIMNQAVGAKGSRIKGDIANKIQQIYNATKARKLVGGVAVLSDALISTPDKLVMRPLWFGSFVNEFKNQTGSEPNLDLIAKNDEAYMSANEQAINRATEVADEKSIFAGASDNAFTGILKGTIKANQRPWIQTLNTFNKFMTTFLINEFMTARTGIYAAMGNGSLSRKQGVALLAGVTTRMVMYSVMLPILNEIMISFFAPDAEEEDKENFLQRLSKGTISAVSSLLLGRDFGNIAKVPISYGIERINAEYLDFLRNGDYNPYEDAIAFSQIPVDEKSKKGVDYRDFLINVMGPASPAIRTSIFALEKISAEPKKERDAIARAKEEKYIRIPLEAAGQAGLIPLYKDIHKVVLAEMYKDLNKAEKSNDVFGKTGKKNLELLYPEVYNEFYGKDGTMLEYDQIKKELERERKLILESAKYEGAR